MMVCDSRDKWMDSRSLWAVELKSLANGLDGGVRKREKSKDDLLV